MWQQVKAAVQGGVQEFASVAIASVAEGVHAVQVECLWNGALRGARPRALRPCWDTEPVIDRRSNNRCRLPCLFLSGAECPPAAR